MDNKVFYQLKQGTDRLQLICFPYLGGYINSFSQLIDELDDTIEVWGANLPGHGSCRLELMTDIKSVVDLYYEKLRPIIKPNSVFFGHSMGGIVAYFLAARIFQSDDYAAKPRALILSACDVPSNFETKVHSTLPDDKLIELLISYDGISDELIHEKSLLAYFIPIYRADFKVIEDSAKRAFRPIDIPAYFLWGEEDKIAPLSSIVQWLNYFKNEIKIIPIKHAAHMFVHNYPAVVAGHLETIGTLVTH